MKDSTFAFLSSRIDTLKHQRASIYAACSNVGVEIWVSEIPTEKGVAGEPLSQIAQLCLDKVWLAEVLVLLLEGSYGDTASEELGDLSILELEVALAALTGKTILAYQLTDDQPDARLVGLLSALSNIQGVVVKATFHETMLLANEIATTLRNHMRQRAAANAREGLFPLCLVRWLDPRTTAVERELATPTTPLLFSMVTPLPAPHANISRARELLVEADTLAHARQQQLLKLWSALRHLAATPWNDSQDPFVLETWLLFLSQWDRVTAWLGTHTNAFLGRYAAQRERQEVWTRLCRIQPEVDRREPSVGIAGASASLLYSVAKRQRSFAAARRLRRQALQAVNAALEDSTASDVSGLLSTRSQILLLLGHPFLARNDSGRALALRQAAGEELGRIGESEATHGWVLAACLRPRESLALLRSGVAKLRGSDRYGFTARAMRKLGIVLALHLRLREAERTWSEAEALASKHQLYDQTRQLHALLSAVRRLQSMISLRFFVRSSAK